MDDNLRCAIGLDADLAISYARDRYEEVKSAYRRVEDKANFLLAILGVEISSLLAVFGLINPPQLIDSGLSVKLMFLFLCACCICVAICFVYLWSSWRLMDMPRMPIHRNRKEHDFFFVGSNVDTF